MWHTASGHKGTGFLKMKVNRRHVCRNGCYRTVMGFNSCWQSSFFFGFLSVGKVGSSARQAVFSRWIYILYGSRITTKVVNVRVWDVPAAVRWALSSCSLYLFSCVPFHDFFEQLITSVLSCCDLCQDKGMDTHVFSLKLNIMIKIY